MSAPYDVCVRGSGPVGMALALSLARQGLQIAWQHDAVSGTTSPGREDIRTYALSGTSVRLLEALKVWSALPADARTPVYDMRVQGDRAEATLGFSAWSQGVDALTWIVDAAELERALATALRFAAHVTPVTQAVPAGLLALAEGKHSATRRQLGVDMVLQPFGQRAVATRLVADRAHQGVARQWFRAPDVLALLPFDRPSSGSSYGLVWSLPDDRADAVMALSDEAFAQAVSEATGWAAGALRTAGPRVAWPLLHGQARRVCGPGWVLLGDAAHVVHPLAGQGLNLGLADVQVLSQVIAGREPFRGLGDERLLRRYARQRHAPVQAMDTLTAGLLGLFASAHPVAGELRNRGLGLLDALPPLKRLLAGRAIDS